MVLGIVLYSELLGGQYNNNSYRSARKILLSTTGSSSIYSKFTIRATHAPIQGLRANLGGTAAAARGQ